MYSVAGLVSTGSMCIKMKGETGSNGPSHLKSVSISEALNCRVADPWAAPSGMMMVTPYLYEW